MPMASEKQRRAMHAAAQGNSTLDIPKAVGKEFVAADQGGKLPVRKKPPGGGQFGLPKSGGMKAMKMKG
jgi:hypothetical protein